MPMNRAQRRKMKAHAEAAAALMASRCYDFRAGGDLVAIAAPKAIAALTRAFTHLLRNGGQSLAVPISEAEAEGFPRWSRERAPDGVTWLAVGLDPEGRASYALQSASCPVKAFAHDAAREKALSRLAGVCATKGFPIRPARDRG